MYRYFLLISVFFFSSLNAQVLTLEVSSEAALLINTDTGRILFEKNKDRILYPASITKVATALYLLSKFQKHLDDKIVAKKEALRSITPQAKKQSNYRCPAYWIETDATHIGIKGGEEFKVIDLLSAILIVSANDAANVVAEHFGGTIPEFMEKMNQFLKELGCKNTTFYNPHGLHFPDHKTTAHDMSLIAMEAMKIPLFRKLVAITSCTIPRTNLSEERHILQTNRLLRSGPHFYKKAIGIKTGYTQAAGKTLIAGAKGPDRTLIAVILNSQTNQERYGDVIKMFDKAFSEKKMRQFLLPQGVQKIKAKVPHGKNTLKTYLREPLYYDFYPSEKKQPKVKVVWSIPILPIEKHQCIGKAIVFDDAGTTLSEAPLYAVERVAPTFYYRCKQALFSQGKLLTKIVLGSLAIVVLLYLWNHRGGRKRKRSVYF